MARVDGIGAVAPVAGDATGPAVTSHPTVALFAGMTCCRGAPFPASSARPASPAGPAVTASSAADIVRQRVADRPVGASAANTAVAAGPARPAVTAVAELGTALAAGATGTAGPAGLTSAAAIARGEPAAALGTDPPGSTGPTGAAVAEPPAIATYPAVTAVGGTGRPSGISARPAVATACSERGRAAETDAGTGSARAAGPVIPGVTAGAAGAARGVDTICPPSGSVSPADQPRVIGTPVAPSPPSPAVPASPPLPPLPP